MAYMKRLHESRRKMKRELAIRYTKSPSHDEAFLRVSRDKAPGRTVKLAAVKAQIRTMEMVAERRSGGDGSKTSARCSWWS